MAHMEVIKTGLAEMSGVEKKRLYCLYAIRDMKRFMKEYEGMPECKSVINDMAEAKKVLEKEAERNKILLWKMKHENEDKR